MPDFRRGREAIKAAKEENEKRRAAGGGTFAPSIFLKEDGEEKYLLFLNEIDEIPRVEHIGFIPQEGEKADGSKFEYYEAVIARTDPSIGEDSDPLVKDWDATPRDSNIAVAVELEPKIKVVKGRNRPDGFEVKTVEYERRIRDDDGEATDETESVVAPAIGFVVQSPLNFFNVLESYDAKDAPINETPVRITRVGDGSDTVYTVSGFPDQDIDMANLFGNIEGIGYLRDDAEEVAKEVAEEEDELVAANKLGSILLEKRLEELGDEERYERIYKKVDKSLDRFGSKKKRDKKDKGSERKSRRSQKKDEKEEPKEEKKGSSSLERLKARAAQTRKE